MNAVAVTIQAKLNPINESQHIYPPTFADVGHNLVGFEKATGSFKAVEIDSVGSFANRMELELAETGLLPDIQVEVADRKLSVHDLPHRIYDAILRDSLLDGTPWRSSNIGNELLVSNQSNATALYRYAPLTLLLGGWDSHGGDAGRGTKLARSAKGEIWGFDGKVAKHLTQRIDPLDIGSSSEPHSVVDGILTPDPKGKKPSELGHGDVPGKADKGVLIDRIELSAAISLSRLSRYRFPDDEGNHSIERDQAARNVLVEIAKLGISRVMDRLDLRSGCELYTESRSCTRILADGSKVDESISSDVAALEQAIAEAETYGLVMNSVPLQLVAGDALQKLANKGLVS